MIVRSFGVVLLGICLLSGLAPGGAAASTDPLVVAQAEGTRDGELEPRYQPREPEPEPPYNSSYVFALTRGVANAAIAPAGQVLLFPLTVPLDLVLLPFALIGGLF